MPNSPKSAASGSTGSGQASIAFASHRTGEGLSAYRAHGAVRMEADGAAARAAIVRDYLADRDARPDGTRVATAHRRADVRAINDAIRSALQDSGALARGEAAGEIRFQTTNGPRLFAPGDRIVFLENDRELGVKNGMLGTIEAVEPHAIQVRLDGKAGREALRKVTVTPEAYQAVDHGYATTIHKTQGATVDRAFVLASETMDRHLTYVAMTRHRDGVQLYASQAEFAGRNAGRLIEHGRAPYQNDPKNRASYFVTIEGDGGQRRTLWGVGLERALAEAGPSIGDRIVLEAAGSETVRLPGGGTGERQEWKVSSARDAAWRQLESRLSRSGLKETTLDYALDFAERRGIAETLGVRSEIEIRAGQASTAGRRRRRPETAAAVIGRPAGDRPQRGFTAQARPRLARSLGAACSTGSSSTPAASRRARRRTGRARGVRARLVAGAFPLALRAGSRSSRAGAWRGRRSFIGKAFRSPKRKAGRWTPPGRAWTRRGRERWRCCDPPGRMTHKSSAPCPIFPARHASIRSSRASIASAPRSPIRTSGPSASFIAGRNCRASATSSAGRSMPSASGSRARCAP